MTVDLFSESGAEISPCKKYRYSLWRIWDQGKPLCMFIMLNPSTADANEDDPTIRRCIGFAKSWGYGGILIGNLFSFRTKNPEKLWTAYLNYLCRSKNIEPNDQFYFHYLKEMKDKIDGIVIAGWGNNGKNYERQIKKTRSVFPVLYHLGLTKNGQPRHPLYLKSDTKPILWEQP